MRDQQANAEKPSASGDALRPMVEHEKRLLLIAAVALPSLFLLSLWLGYWISGALHVLFCSGVLISALLANRIAVNGSRLWAIPVGLGMSGATLLLLLCIDRVTGGGRTSGSLPSSWFGFAGAAGVFFSLYTLGLARSQRHRLNQANAPGDPSAKSPDTRD